MKKKTTALFLALIMVLCLLACSGSNEDAAQLGTYTLYAMDYDETSVVRADELFEGKNYVTLNKGGSAEICMEDTVSSVKWKTDGDKITLIAADGDMEGTLKNGILTLVLDGTNLYFVGENGKADSLHALTLNEILFGESGDPNPTNTAEPAPQPAELTEVQKMWNGWWYGCADLEDGMTFDAAMLVELDADGSGTLGIYDPYGAMAVGPNNNRYTTIECHADLNYLYGDSGTILDTPIRSSDWMFVHNLMNPNKIHVSSSFTANNGNEVHVDFMFLPWGDRWDNEPYSQFIPHFADYLAMLDAGKASPFDDGTGSGEQPQGAPSTGDSGELSPLLGASPAVLDVNGKGAVLIYYPADRFYYNSDYGKLKNDETGVGILIDPMLGANNLDELKKSYEEHNSTADDYSLTETTVNGYRAIIMTYSDWLGATMRVDVDFGGSHDGFYGMSFAVSGDSLSDCNTDLVWAIIQSMKVVK